MKTPRSQEEVDAVRRRILNASLEIIDDAGISGLTMRGLARATGMTAPNLYNYFAGKDEIYLTLMVEGFQELSSRLEGAADRNADPRARGRAMMLSYLHFGLDQPRLYRLMFATGTPKHETFVGTDQEDLSNREFGMSMALVELSVAAIRELAREEGRPMDETEARTVLAGCWSLLHGWITLTGTENLRYVVDDPMQTGEGVIDMLLNALP